MRLTLIPRRTTFGTDGPILDTFPGLDGQFFATKNGVPRLVLAPNQIFHDTPLPLSLLHPPLPLSLLLLISDSQVGTVQATDPDGDPVTYYVESNTINSENFQVNGSSGILHTSRQLDREVHVCV